MPSSPATLVAIATFNEIENLPRLVEQIWRQVPDAHVLVVDDRSPDGTGDWCEARSREDPRMHVLHRAGKLGLGTATIAGLQYAIRHDYEFVVTMDADFSHDPVHLPGMLGLMQTDSPRIDLVIGSRYVVGGGVEGWPLRRRVMSRAINWYARIMLGLESRDCSGAFRCFRVSMLKKLDFRGLLSHGYSLLEELLWRIQRQGAVIREVPITFVDRTHGQSKISYREAVMALWIIFRLGLVHWLRPPSSGDDKPL